MDEGAGREAEKCYPEVITSEIFETENLIISSSSLSHSQTLSMPFSPHNLGFFAA
jgi:hypothetical protein